ncbi:MAG: Arc family DNA-binding protein [Gemmatimonadales bacterium]|nr:Arc family DNA-binding protein [Gemmatimonadales bacterium]MDZ4389277.1 Arc family DNA-binding protein [Gemmatimonadales bacterium]
MATLTIKNLPDPLYARLKARAKEHRRSINSEAILAVERALAGAGAGDPAKLLATLRQSRARLKGLYLTDKELRAARESGRA